MLVIGIYSSLWVMYISLMRSELPEAAEMLLYETSDLNV